MIFATDLDRTMIYSEKFLEDFKEEVIHIEIFKERPISYISSKALESLKKLNQVATIIPTTMRNFEQYHRISLFSEYIVPKFYVINNGGAIFKDGKEDISWTRVIQNQLGQLVISYEEALQIFLNLYKGPIEQYKKSDDLIWLVLGDKNQIDWEGIKAYKERIQNSGWSIDVNERKIYLYPSCINKWAALDYIRKNQIDWEGIKAYKERIQNSGWSIDVNERKIYLYPSCINKWAALDYIRRCYMKAPILAAGDSLFDCEMVTKADFGVIPKGSWLEQNMTLTKNQKEIYITQRAGLAAAEDLLAYALEQVAKLNSLTRHMI